MSQPEPITKPHPCLECGGESHPIIVLETGYRDRHQVLEFATSDAKPGWFLGRFATKGFVGAEMCVQCGRITLRAVPKSTE